MKTNQLNTAAVLHRASRKITGFAMAMLCVSGAPGSARAQSDTARDSLAARLRRAEQAIATLQQQLGEQSQGGARTRSGASIQFYGRVAVNGFGNSRRVNNVDNPQFVRPDTAASFPVRGVGMAIRQTTLGLAVSAPDVLGGAFTGDVDVDFYGGQMASSGGRTFPLLRIRTARGVVRWTHATLLIGQESPLVSGLNPVTPAAIGTPDFAAAGNLWLWLPQVRAGIERAGRVRLGLQAAVLAPTSGDPVATFDTDYDQAEKSQRPFLQARAYVGWGSDERAGEVGCGVHHGWLMIPAVPTSPREESRAVACDARVPVVPQLELRGEFFDGAGLRGLGGGGIGQNFTTANAVLHTTGGWAQVNVRPVFPLRAGVGCGTDQPESGAARTRNGACAIYAMVRGAGPLFVGAELRRLRTRYAAGSQDFTNDHVTVATGFEF
jgi:hypothetical protein